MRVGLVILPDLDWRQAKPRWQHIEELGFDHGWTFDHLAWRSFADGPWFGAVPLLAAAATATSRIQLGTFVASPNFRHPVPFAKELMTLDHISDGRFLLGAGSGSMGLDFPVLGTEPLSLGQRSQRFEEFVELLDQLLTQPATNYAGEYFSAVDAKMIPGCVQSARIPFLIAANGPRMMRLAARYGQGWITTGHSDTADSTASWWRGIANLAAAMDESLAESGRDPQGFGRYLNLDAFTDYSLQSVGHFEDCLGQAKELGFTDVVAYYPREEGLYAGNVKVLEEVATRR